MQKHLKIVSRNHNIDLKELILTFVYYFKITGFLYLFPTEQYSTCLEYLP